MDIEIKYFFLFLFGIKYRVIIYNKESLNERKNYNGDILQLNTQ